MNCRHGLLCPCRDLADARLRELTQLKAAAKLLIGMARENIKERMKPEVATEHPAVYVNPASPGDVLRACENLEVLL